MKQVALDSLVCPRVSARTQWLLVVVGRILVVLIISETTFRDSSSTRLMGSQIWKKRKKWMLRRW